MKKSLKYLSTLTVALTFGAVALSAQSSAAAGHASHAVTHSAAASGEALAAVGDSAASGVKVVSGIAAVPVWISGSIVGGVGAISTEAGKGAIEGGNKLWDFANGAPEERPHVNRERAVPPLKKRTNKPAADPSPAMMLKQPL